MDVTLCEEDAGSSAAGKTAAILTVHDDHSHLRCWWSTTALVAEGKCGSFREPQQKSLRRRQRRLLMSQNQQHSDFCRACDKCVGSLIDCDFCSDAYHASCLVEPPHSSSMWMCPECVVSFGGGTSKIAMSGGPSKKARRQQETLRATYKAAKQETMKKAPTRETASVMWDGSLHEDYCFACQDGGELLCCDSCPNVWHASCLDPPLSSLPKGDWYCPQCNPVAPEKRQQQPAKKAVPAKKSASLTNVRPASKKTREGERPESLKSAPRPKRARVRQSDPFEMVSSLSFAEQIELALRQSETQSLRRHDRASTAVAPATRTDESESKEDEQELVQPKTRNRLGDDADSLGKSTALQLGLLESPSASA